MKSLLVTNSGPVIAKLKRRNFAVSMLFTCMFLVANPAARGQLANVDDATSTPIEGVGHDYIKALSETVNPASGSVSLRIALPVPKGRGMTPSFSIDYDSNSVHHLELTSTPGFAAWVSNGDTWGAYATAAPGGWSFGVPTLYYNESDINIDTGTYDYNGFPNTYTCQSYSNYMFTDMTGGAHALGIGTQISNGGTCFGAAAGGGDPQVQAVLTGNPPNWTNNKNSPPQYPTEVYTPDGTAYTFNSEFSSLPTTIEDRNGNVLTFKDYELSSNIVNDHFTVTDTAGRTVIYSSGNATTNAVETLVVGGLTYQIYWTAISASANVPAQWAGYTPGPAQFGPSGLDYCASGTGLPPIQDTQAAISQILLPNGQSYQFHYESTYGLLSEIDYPTGAWVKYTWKPSDTFNELANYPGSGTVSVPCLGDACNQGLTQAEPVTDGCLYLYSSPVVATRQVGFTAGGSAAQTQSFTYSTSWGAIGTVNGILWSQKTTQVATADNVRGGISANTNYTYKPISGPSNNPFNAGFASLIPVESEIDYYDYSSGSGNGPLLETVKKTWLNQYQLARSQTVPAGGSASYEVAYGYTQGSDPFGLENEEDKYDFGNLPLLPNVPTNSPTQMTHTNYQAFAGMPYLADQPSSVVVCSGGSSCSSSTAVAETDYLYDGGTISPISGLPAGTHDETNYSPVATTPRGNITAVTKKCLNCVDAVTHYTYDETGQVASMTDPRRNSTSYSFADNPSGGNSAGNSNAYLTQITYPSVNGVAHRENFQYNYASGYLTEADDENGQPTNYTYNDLLMRPTAVQGPPDPNNGNQRPTTTISYSDAPPTLSITATVVQSPNPPKTSVQYMDGMGHTVQTQLTTDPDGPDYVTTIYDGNGHVYQKANPTRCSSSPGVMPGSCQESTWGITAYSYDAMGRPVAQQQPNNSVLTWCYNNLASTMPTGVTAVCNGHIGNSPADTWVDSTDENGNDWQRTSDAFGNLIQVMEPSGTSKNPPTVETDYGYNTLNNLMSVTQRGGAYNSPGARARSFSYDSLSRLLSATNPETGAVGYTYDANSNVVTKTDARGIMSTYGYDVLNRLTSKTYSSNDASKTPISCFQYDISSIPGAGGNMIGRLTNQWTIASGSSCTNSPSGSFYALRSILSYDAAGRITNEQQCTPNNCTSGSGPTVSYGYDLAGNNTSLTNSVGAVNGLRQTMPLVLTTGFDGATHTSSLTSNWTSFSPNLFTIAPTNGYAAFGGPANWSLGPSLSVTQSYMNRLWVNNITATGQVR